MKIKEQVLSREQMAHLQELGVDTSDASMAWMSNSDNPKADDWTIEIPNEFLEHYYQVPTYTIGDLIEKLPKNIDKKTFTMSYLIAPSVGYSLSKHVMIPSQQNGLVDALYSLLCWVAENHVESIK